MDVRLIRHGQPWLWLVGLFLSCGSRSEAACKEATAIADQIEQQAANDRISTTGICVLSQQDLEARLRANGIPGDVAPARAAQYVDACRRLSLASDECHR